MKKIVLCIDKQDDDFALMAQKLGEVAQVSVAVGTDPDLSNCDIFIGKRLSKAQLDGAPHLQAAFAYKTGVDEFAMDEMQKRGIPLYNSHVNSACIAQYAFALALAITARIVEFDKNLRQGNWTVGECWNSLYNMKVGIVGYGSIGKEVKKLLEANNISAYTIDRGKTYDIPTVDNLFALCDLCDLLIIALPKTAETTDMFNAEAFSHLKGKYIVNVGRGNCIDEEALYQSLKKGELAGAAIDTWRIKSRSEKKLFPSRKHFEKLNNVLLSPHKAMQIGNGHSLYVADVTDNVLGYLSGAPARNPVDLTKGY